MTVAESFKLPSGVTLKNRLVFAPISTLASETNGSVSKEDISFFSKRTGDVGAIVIASAYVSLQGKAYENGLSVSQDWLIPSLKKLVKTIQRDGTKAFLQIYHGGAMTHYYPGNQELTCVSQTSPCLLEGKTYEELTEANIEDIMVSYEKAVKRALKAGFDGVEIHAANSYLPNQFLMSSWNHRTDKFGQTLANRFTFLKDLITRCQVVIEKESDRPFALGIRMSLQDSMCMTDSDKEQSVKESIFYLHELDALGLDYIHVNSHDILGQVMIDGQSVEWLEALNVIIEQTPLIGCGNILHAQDVAQALVKSELVSACRPFIFEPEWASKILNDIPIELVDDSENKKLREELAIPRNLWRSVNHSKEWYLYK
ncbi:MAG: hypothetical protein ACTJHC_05870 [Vagococcus sp.]